MKIKENEKIKQYLYMLVGKELTRQDYEKILDYFNRVKQEKDHYKNKRLNNLFMKDFNGEKIFCLENDKETFADMIFLLQERINSAIDFLNTEYNTYPSSEAWRKALIKILSGDNDDNNSNSN